MADNTVKLFYFDGFAVDVVVRSERTADSDVTEFEVEAGAAFADHIRARPEEISFDVVISDTPLAAAASIRGPERIAAGRNRDGLTFSQEAVAWFNGIRDAGLPVTIQGPGVIYESMAMTSLGEPREIGDEGGVRLAVAFRKVRVVSTTRTTVSIPRANGRSKAKPGTIARVAESAATTILGPFGEIGEDLSYFFDGKVVGPDLRETDGDPWAGALPAKRDDAAGRYVDTATGDPIQQLPVGSDEKPWWTR